MDGFEFTLADPDFYVPPTRWETAGPGYRPSRPPAGWSCREDGLWARWLPDGHVIAAQGWKVHVSARLERAQQVLDVVADVCAEQGVAFKHLRTQRGFLWAHHKHGPRSQSGKFCAAYPADQQAAGRLMTVLESALADERGPYVLTDRRFGASSVVFYRYGAFLPRYQLRPDGTQSALLTAPDGTELADERQPRFHLPAGITDPFAPPAQALAAEPLTEGEPLSFNGYTFQAVLQFSNAGGAYRGTAPDGRPVFIKEARQDNGYQWEGSTAAQRLEREYLTLSELHAACPGICPAPLDYFRHWEHTFLVTELVPGRSLWSWCAQGNPLFGADSDPARCRAHYDRCRRLLDALEEEIGRLHAAGYVFIDLNPRNILVDDQDRPRLIDFEEARRIDQPRTVHGAEGYLPPEAWSDPAAISDARYYDEYALAAIAQLMLHPLHPVLARSPETADHLAADLPVVPEDLVRRANRIIPPVRQARLPSPGQVADEPERWTGWLCERVCDGLESLIDADSDPPFPGTPQSYATNPYNVAYGMAGIVYALHRAGRPPAPRTVGWLLDGALRDRADLPPGLFVGTAGLAWVLAGLGHLDAAGELLSHADRHPLTSQDATLAHGRAGVALAHLALFGHDGDQGHLTAAGDLLATIADGDALVPLLGSGNPTGWRAGRPGIALSLHYLAQLTGDGDAAERGQRLLLADLRHAYADGDGLQLRVSATEQRVEPYLASGSAGFALVAGRYVASGGARADVADAYQRCLRSVSAIRFPLLPALFEGLSGMGLVLSDLAALTDDDDLRVAARRSARALFKYLVPRDGGICVLSLGRRISADLSSGSAGVALFLAHLGAARPDPLFTLDALTRAAAGAGIPGAAGAGTGLPLGGPQRSQESLG